LHSLDKKSLRDFLPVTEALCLLSNLVKLSKSLVEPSPTKLPFYHGDSSGNPQYRFLCRSCESTVEVPFTDLLHSTWGWKENFSEHEVLEIQKHFSIGPSNRTPEGGWPCVTLVSCKNCNSKYLSYIGFDEYSNSVYRLTEQGLSIVET